MLVKPREKNRICEDCGKETDKADTYLFIGSRWGETTEVYLCPKCAKLYGKSACKRRKVV